MPGMQTWQGVGHGRTELAAFRGATPALWRVQDHRTLRCARVAARAEASMRVPMHAERRARASGPSAAASIG